MGKLRWSLLFDWRRVLSDVGLETVKLFFALKYLDRWDELRGRVVLQTVVDGKLLWFEGGAVEEVIWATEEELGAVLAEMTGSATAEKLVRRSLPERE